VAPTVQDIKLASYSELPLHTVGHS